VTRAHPIGNLPPIFNGQINPRTVGITQLDPGDDHALIDVAGGCRQEVEPLKSSADGNVIHIRPAYVAESGAGSRHFDNTVDLKRHTLHDLPTAREHPVGANGLELIGAEERLEIDRPRRVGREEVAGREPKRKTCENRKFHGVHDMTTIRRHRIMKTPAEQRWR
jgi:hypothetical protein